MKRMLLTRQQKFRSPVIFILIALTVGTAYAVVRFTHGASGVATDIAGRKMVWVHSIPNVNGIGDPNGYGSNYPFYYMNTANYGSSQDKAIQNVADAIKAGVDGINLDTFVRVDANGNGVDVTPNFIAPYLNEADKTNLVIAPTIDLGNMVSDTSAHKISAVEAMVNAYCTLAPSHKSAAYMGAKPVIFVYSGNILTAAEWKKTKDDIASTGCSIFYVISAPYSQYGDTASNYQAYFPAADYGWSWPGLKTAAFTSLAKSWSTGTTAFPSGRPFIGGIWPGLVRTSGSIAAYEAKSFLISPGDLNATGFFREQWDQQLAASLPWMSVSTLDDFTERHNIDNSSDWNTTRSDLTAWYSAKFRGTALPFSSPQLYITTPQAVYSDETKNVEALVLNGGSISTVVSLQLYDQTGKASGAAASTTVPSKTLGVATSTVSCAGNTAAGKWYYARATMSDGTTVTSAPILCYTVANPLAAVATPTSTDPNHTSDKRFTLYYSIPASHNLGHIDLKASGSGDATVVTVTPPVGTNARFSDVLRNTRLIGNGFTAPFVSKTVSTMTQLSHGQSIDTRGDETDYGFYVARVIDQSGRVGYSWPYNSTLPTAAHPTAIPVDSGPVPVSALTPTPAPTPAPTPIPVVTPAPTPVPVSAQATPDLIITDVSWSPVSPKTGDAVTFRATIKNNGTAATPPGTIAGVSFSVDGKQVSWSDTQTSSIAPGASVTLIANNGPSGSANWIASTASTKTVFAYVDDINRIPNETSESNNTLSKSITVVAGPTVDLVVTNLTWSPSKVRKGNKVVFSATVKNIGTSATPPNTLVGLGFYVNGTEVSWNTTQTAPIPAGGSVTLTANTGPNNSNYWIPVGTGNYTVVAFIDDVNRITNEINETNNKLSKTLSVR